MMNCFQNLLSNSTCAINPGGGGSIAVRSGSVRPAGSSKSSGRNTYLLRDNESAAAAYNAAQGGGRAAQDVSREMHARAS